MMDAFKDQQSLSSKSKLPSSLIPRLWRSQSLREKGKQLVLPSFNEQLEEFNFHVPYSRHSITSRVPIPIRKVGQKHHGSTEMCFRSRSVTIGHPIQSQEYFTPMTPDGENGSLKSFGSSGSFMSCDITPRSVFSRSSSYGVNWVPPEKKYILHCQRTYESPEEYLTPTQRKNRQIHQLKAALARATKACEVKDVEIEHLYAEVERLRRSSLQQPDTGSRRTLVSTSPVLNEIDAPRHFLSAQISDSSDTMEEVDLVIERSTNVEKSLYLEDSGILSDVGSLSSPSEMHDTCSSDQETFSSNVNYNTCKFPKDEATTKETHFDINDKSQLSEIELPLFTSNETSSVHVSGNDCCVDNARLKHETCLTPSPCKVKESIERPSLTDSNENCSTSKENKSLKILNRNIPVTTNVIENKKESVQVGTSNEYTHNCSCTTSERISGSTKNKNLVIFEEDAFEDYERELKELKIQYSKQYQELKEKHDNEIGNLSQKLANVNARYLELQPMYEKALDQIKCLENQVVKLKKDISAQEEWHKQMYLKMYRKGQEAAKFEHADEVLEFAQQAPKKISVPELLQQLRQTKQELEQAKELYRSELYRKATTGSPHHQAEYTLKFLKDAVYYFLTEKDNKGHLNAIESILGFSEKERGAVAKSLKHRRI
ncbi:uncharacterized protein LOC111088675 [Limulus polyphemus]|uniref:Uncharacterized protein LOC111088675 n=1 Tax=Limulus polyphemus TaxID=6850 RepID=A0ABM1TGY8_LIMPO|nr:uncharacterized protein LOC111088675 [Limulus polyphemus]